MDKLVKIIRKTLIPLAVLIGFVLLGLSLPIGGRQALSVQSGSMEPAIKTGSLVFVNRVPAESIKSGDVITYINPRNKSQTITHRVYEVQVQKNGKRQFITKGDANTVTDLPISERNVIGIVNGSVPFIGKVTDFVRHPIGLLLIIYIPALIIVINEVKLLAAYYRRMHYILPEFLAQRRMNNSNIGQQLLISGMVGLFTLAVALPANALFKSSASLTGNTISIARATEPEPELPRGARIFGVTLRRVHLTCGTDGSTSTVEAMFYNSSSENVDASGWTVKSGIVTLLTLPAGTIVLANSIFEADGPKPADVTYSEENLKLFDSENELKDELTWSPDVYASRDCRINP